MSNTRFTRELIRDTIKEANTLNRSVLTYMISDQLVERYEDAYLESLLKRIGLETTKDIHEALDEYILKNRKKLEKEGLADDGE